MRIRYLYLAVAAALALPAQAAPEDVAVKLVQRAKALVKAKGLAKACAEFADPAKGYIEGEAYVSVLDMNARMLCSPSNPRLVGKDLLELRDSDGRYFNKEMIAAAQSKGSGWIEYRWVNPATKDLQQKKSYFERLDDMVIGSGFYK
jgi:signal transduction histidine kinase